jgi:polysaccharide export outer membrane protein
MGKYYIVIFFFFFSLSACVKNRNIIYFQNDAFKSDSSFQFNNQAPVYKIQTNDVLFVQVYSQEEKNSNLFNLRSLDRVNNVNEALLFIQGYPVDVEGKIAIPNLGVFQVKGLSVDEVKSLIQKELDKYFQEEARYVMVKLVSFKISVLGEVKKPGHFYVYNNQLTLLEAMAIAGDLTDLGNRKKIKLIRQKSGGFEVVVLDITKPETIASKYFYLQPNDQIYVDPMKAKVRRANFPVLTTTFAGISSAVLVINLIRLIDQGR